MIGLSQAFQNYLLELALTSAPIHLVLLNFAPRTYAFSQANLADGLFTLVNHPFVNNLAVSVKPLGETPLAPGFTANATYYISSVQGNTLRLSLSPGGQPLSLQLTNTAVIEEHPLQIEDSPSTLAQLVHHEVNRIPAPLNTETQVRNAGGYQTPFTNVTFTATQSLLFTHYALFLGSTDTAKDTTGFLLSIRELPEPQAVANGQIVTIPLRFFVDQLVP